MLASQSHWEFRSAEDVSRFWDKHRHVPSRADGRKKYQEERFNLGVYLLALATHGLLTYPFCVDQFEEHVSPDFMLAWHSGEMTGLEVTRATAGWLQRAMKWADKEFREREAKASASGREPEPVIIPLSQGGWVDDQAELKWCSVVLKSVEQKVAKVAKFKPASRYDLLISDDTPLPAVNRNKVIECLSPWIKKLKADNPAIGKISILVSLDVIFDLGGECRLFPYVEWSELKRGDRESLMALAGRIEQAGQVAAEKAIGEHAAMGRAVYFMDGRGRLIKQTPDGRRFEVRLLDDGEEVVVKEL